MTERRVIQFSHQSSDLSKCLKNASGGFLTKFTAPIFYIRRNVRGTSYFADVGIKISFIMLTTNTDGHSFNIPFTMDGAKDCPCQLMLASSCPEGDTDASQGKWVRQVAEFQRPLLGSSFHYRLSLHPLMSERYFLYPLKALFPHAELCFCVGTVYT